MVRPQILSTSGGQTGRQKPSVLQNVHKVGASRKPETLADKKSDGQKFLGHLQIKGSGEEGTVD